MVDSRQGALQTAGSWTKADTIWTDGSRLDSGVGAACAWRTLSGWTGRHFYLASNKEVFGAEVYAGYQALGILDQRQDGGRGYTPFVDSASAIARIRTDGIGPGQRFAVASVEVATRIVSSENEFTVRWVPAHHGVPGNERAGELSRAAAKGSCPDDAVPDEYRWETSLSHMTRVAAEACTRSAAEWMRDRFGNLARGYRPPPGRGVRHKLLRRTPKSVTSGYYQLLTGHAVIAPYLKDKIHRATDDRCWRCGGGKQQTRYHLFNECGAWLPQARRVWRAIGRAHGWKQPRAPAIKWLWKEKPTGAILEVLRDTRTGCINSRRFLPEERLGDEVAGSGSGDGGKEKGADPSSM